jgi:hypothetical protein
VNAAQTLLNNPRISNINSSPVNNVAPTITRPFTPFGLDGLANGEFNYAVDQRFRTPYSIQYSFGFQRELPGDFILEASYVGRQGRKLFSQADAAQILNFRDPVSGQLMIDAFNGLQSQLLSGAAITAQPWFENMVAGGTQSVLDFAGLEAERGDTSDAIFLLYAFGVLDPNVGMSAQFGTNIYISNQGASTYDGMLVSLRKRFSHGLQFDLNYTWSHSIDNGSSITNTVTGGLVCDLTNLRVCRGNSDFDIRHLVNANFIYELPFGRGQRFGSGSPVGKSAVFSPLAVACHSARQLAHSPWDSASTAPQA